MLLKEKSVMAELIEIGKIVNTHGIKGELRILSDFEMKPRIFKLSFPLAGPALVGTLSVTLH